MWTEEKLEQAAKEWHDYCLPCDWMESSTAYISFLAGANYILKNIQHV